jgi:hypothetical protein
MIATLATPAPAADPAWCVKCTNPDPGVVVHISAEWSGGSPVDRDASWRIRVVQEYFNGVGQLALLELLDADGAYLSLAAFTAALAEATALKDRINAEVVQRWS